MAVGAVSNAVECITLISESATLIANLFTEAEQTALAAAGIWSTGQRDQLLADAAEAKGSRVVTGTLTADVLLRAIAAVLLGEPGGDGSGPFSYEDLGTAIEIVAGSATGGIRSGVTITP